MIHGEHHVTVSAADEAILVVGELHMSPVRGLAWRPPAAGAWYSSLTWLTTARRWPDFTARAVAAGVRAACSFPLGSASCASARWISTATVPGSLPPPRRRRAGAGRGDLAHHLDVQAQALPGSLLYQSPGVDSSRATLDQAKA